MDIKEQISAVLEKIIKNPDIKKKFSENPIKAVQGILGDKLPEGVLEKIIAGVKAKLTGDKVSGAVDSIKKLF